MPYIKDKDRERIEITGLCRADNLVEELAARIENAGELNYVLTRIIHECLNNWGLSYQVMNDIVGALDNAKDEFRRRVQHPYEDTKIESNGDVHPNNL